MVKITYDTFREVECEFVKYVSQKRGKFKINIIDFRAFKGELLEKYLEEEIQHFFSLFPYDLDSEVRAADKLMSIRLEIAFYADLHLITIEGHEFVLVDQSTEELEDLPFLSKIRSQPIILEEFVVISLNDFINIAQADFSYSLLLNLRDEESQESKKVEWRPGYELYS